MLTSFIRSNSTVDIDDEGQVQKLRIVRPCIFEAKSDVCLKTIAAVMERGRDLYSIHLPEAKVRPRRGSPFDPEKCRAPEGCTRRIVASLGDEDRYGELDGN